MSRQFANYISSRTPDLKIPALLYGTAWKSTATSDLVYRALKAGFRAIDTAAQPKHYNEDLVGSAVKKAIGDGLLKREDLFVIQTKFTSVDGQNVHGMPYDITSPLAEQIHTSVASSLRNFTVNNSEEPYIDCLILHSPMRTDSEPLEAWKTMESYVPHKVRYLGISNIYSLGTLRRLFKNATIKPSVVENRFTAATAYDSEIRGFCNEEGIVYESFWTLTGNPQLLATKEVMLLAEKTGVSREVALYSLVVGQGGISVLDGTTNEGRMKGIWKGWRRLGNGQRPMKGNGWR